MRRASTLLTGFVIVAIVSAVIWRWTHDDAIAVEVYTVSTGEVLSTVANTRAGTVKACQRSTLPQCQWPGNRPQCKRRQPGESR